MTFHGSLPALDSSGVPATLSPRVMTQLLRRDLRFSGLLVTDAMDMRGVTDRYGAVEASKRAIAAGADILLMPADVAGAIEAVVGGVLEHRYTEARLDSSVRRVLVLKRRFGLDRRREVDLGEVRRIVGDSANVSVARRVAERGLVLVKDSLRAVPLPARAPFRVLSIAFAARAELGAGVTFDAELRRAGRTVRSVFMSADDLAPNFTPLLAAADSSDVTLVSSYANITSGTATADAPRAFVEFIRALQSRGSKPVVIAFGNPYLLQQIPSIATYLVAWGPSVASQLAAARALTGQIAISGRLPISIPPIATIGAGERRDARAARVESRDR
jgi:beta-N-acetylhexosaminidase